MITGYDDIPTTNGYARLPNRAEERQRTARQLGHYVGYVFGILAAVLIGSAVLWLIVTIWKSIL